MKWFSNLVALQTINSNIHPFRLFLYLEWILLSITILGELPWDGIPFLGTLLNSPADSPKLGLFSPLLTVLCIASFGLIGLRLPKTRMISKLLYTALELGLIWLAVILGGWWAQYVSLHLIVVTRSCLVFKQVGRLLITGIVFISFLATAIISFSTQNLQEELTDLTQLDPSRIKIGAAIYTINYIFSFGLILVFVLLLVNALVAERLSRQQLALAHEQLRQYALRIEDQATLQERNRIAREIHDSLGHSLTAQSIQLDNALLFYQSDLSKTQIFLSEAKQLGSTALKEIRQSISMLRSDPLQRQSLLLAITKLTQDFHKNTNVTLNPSIKLSDPVTVEIGTAIYRITQEALTNIVKHSHATKVNLRLQTQVGWLHLQIEDNGQGFMPEQTRTGFGIQGMRERAVALGGIFTVTSEPKSGCRIIVKIPLFPLIS